jgi:ATP-dependent Lon protease
LSLQVVIAQLAALHDRVPGRPQALMQLDPLPPGSIYTATVAADGTVGLYRVEVSVATGLGKLRTAGGVNGLSKESINRAFSYMLAKKSELGIGRELDVSDLHVEVIDLMNNRVEGEIGLGFLVAGLSALKKALPRNPSTSIEAPQK